MSSPKWTAPHVIAGKDEWPNSNPIRRTNPADKREIVTLAAPAGEDEVLHAGTAADASFKTWKRVPFGERLAIIGRIAALLTTYMEELKLAMVYEVGKTLAGAEGEVKKAAKIASYYATFDPAWFWQEMSARPGVKRSVRKLPRGVVVVITAFNFPLALAVWKTIPAILAGCTVLYKPSELTPYTAYLLMKVFKEAGLPDGVVNLVHGDGVIGGQLIMLPCVHAVSFTGSVPVGRAVAAAAADRMIPATCEMGGLNAMVMLEDWRDRIPEFARDVRAAGWMAAGQRCTSAKRVFVPAPLYDDVVAALDAEAGNIVVGHGIDPATHMEPLASEHQLWTVLADIRRGVDSGMQFLFGGERIIGDGFGDGNFIEPTLLAGDPHNGDHVPFHREVFGPVVSVAKFDTFEEAMFLLNGTTYGHCASLYTDDEDRVKVFLEDGEVGMRHVREHTLGGDEDMPFIGWRASGFGSPEMGQHGVDFYCRTTANYVNDGQTAVAATQR